MGWLAAARGEERPPLDTSPLKDHELGEWNGFSNSEEAGTNALPAVDTEHVGGVDNATAPSMVTTLRYSHDSQAFKR